MNEAWKVPTEKEIEQMAKSLDVSNKIRIDKLIGKSYEYGGNLWALLSYEYDTANREVRFITNDPKNQLKVITFAHLESFLSKMHEVSPRVQTTEELTEKAKGAAIELAKQGLGMGAPVRQMVQPEKKPEGPIQSETPELQNPTPPAPAKGATSFDVMALEFMQNTNANCKAMGTLMLESMRKVQAGTMSSEAGNAIAHLSAAYSTQTMTQIKLFAALNNQRNKKGSQGDEPGSLGEGKEG